MSPSNDHQNNNEEQSVESATTTKRCGLFCWRPDCLQVGYNWSLGFTLFCWFSFLHGFFMNGLQAANTVALMIKFEVDSQMIGWFTAANMFSVAGTTIISSYLADRTSNKPRMLSFAAFTYVIGSLLMCLPHFIMDPFKSPADQMALMCYTDWGYWATEFANSSLINEMFSMTSMSDLSTLFCNTTSVSASSYFPFMIAGNVVTGIGAAIVWTIGVSFIDDFSTTTQSGLRIGIAYFINAVGTGIGMGAGSGFLRIDVNFDKPGAPPQNTLDPAYLGAWWLGYAICMGLFATVAIGFFFFDNELPETAKLRVEKLAKNQAHVSGINVNFDRGVRNKFVKFFTSFFTRLLRILTNPVVVLVTLAVTAQGLPVNGLQPFIISMMQSQYGISDLQASIAMAVLIVLSIASSTFLSGLVAERFAMSIRSLLLMTIIFSIFSLGLGFMCLLTCGNEKFVGVYYDLETSSYYDIERKFNASQLKSTCNADCECEPYYTPVCHAESQLQFLSPCHAGCLHFGKTAKNEIDYYSFNDCTCLQGRNFNSSSLSYGLCNSGGCANMYIGLVGMFFLLFCGFFILVPITGIILRVVAHEDRSFSLAFNQAVQYFLGYIPGPIFIGYIFEQVCALRQPNPCPDKNGNTKPGTCIVYDSNVLSWWLNGVVSGFAFLGILFLISAFFTYRPPSGETFGQYFRHLGKWWCGCFRKRKTGDVQHRPKRRMHPRQDSGHDVPYAMSLESPASSPNSDTMIANNDAYRAIS